MKIGKELSPALQARAGRGLERAGSIALCAVAIGALSLLVGMARLALGFALAAAGLKTVPVLGGAAQFLIPALPGAALLRACFREERRPALWVTLGLLAAWGGVFGAAERLFAGSVTRVLPPVYLALTLLGCLALGQIFGRRTGRQCVILFLDKKV